MLPTRSAFKRTRGSRASRFKEFLDIASTTTLDLRVLMFSLSYQTCSCEFGFRRPWAHGPLIGIPHKPTGNLIGRGQAAGARIVDHLDAHGCTVTPVPSPFWSEKWTHDAWRRLDFGQSPVRIHGFGGDPLAAASAAGRKSHAESSIPLASVASSAEITITSGLSPRKTPSEASGQLTVRFGRALKNSVGAGYRRPVEPNTPPPRDGPGKSRERPRGLVRPADGVVLWGVVARLLLAGCRRIARATIRTSCLFHEVRHLIASRVYSARGSRHSLSRSRAAYRGFRSPGCCRARSTPG